MRYLNSTQCNAHNAYRIVSLIYMGGHFVSVFQLCGKPLCTCKSLLSMAHGAPPGLVCEGQLTRISGTTAGNNAKARSHGNAALVLCGLDAAYKVCSGFVYCDTERPALTCQSI